MAGGLPFPEVEGAAHDAAAGKPLAEAARAAIAAADAALTQAGRDADTGRRLSTLACAAGCGWCCHQMVGVTPAEAALLGEALALWTAEDRARLKARVAETAARGRGLDQRGWWAARLACPLLDDGGRCALHPVRPLPCRGYTSADAALCRRSLEGEAVRIPVLAAQWGIYGHAQAGLARALAEAGTDPGPVSLVDALAGVLG